MRSVAWLVLAPAVLALGCAEPSPPPTSTVVELPALPSDATPADAPSSTRLRDEEPAPKPKAGEPRPLEGYSCSMHPHVHRPDPGACPVCGMDLVPLRGRRDAD